MLFRSGRFNAVSFVLLSLSYIFFKPTPFSLHCFLCDCCFQLFTFQDKLNSTAELSYGGALGQVKMNSSPRRKTKIVCTIGPSTSSREMIWKLAEAGMNVARLNMSHGDHASHQKTIDLVKEYNAQFEDKVIAIMLDTKVSNSNPFIDIVSF